MGVRRVCDGCAMGVHWACTGPIIMGLQDYQLDDVFVPCHRLFLGTTRGSTYLLAGLATSAPAKS